MSQSFQRGRAQSKYQDHFELNGEVFKGTKTRERVHKREEPAQVVKSPTQVKKKPTQTEFESKQPRKNCHHYGRSSPLACPLSSESSRHTTYLHTLDGSIRGPAQPKLVEFIGSIYRVLNFALLDLLPHPY